MSEKVVRSRIVELIEHQDAEKVQELLDDLVHNCASQHASEINNQGLEEQLAYLSDQMGLKSLEMSLRAALKEPK